MKIVGSLGERRTAAVWAFVTLGVALVVVALSVWVVLRSDSPKQTPKPDSKAKSQQITREVGDVYLLPQDETPTVAQIEDISKLSGQEFYKQAKTGDYLLVYSKARLALIYRDSVGKLVNVGPVQIQNKNLPQDNP